jgi:4-hydroxybenzoate polyprenyltransferase
MKRITYWPQAWLGVAINFGAIVSWLTVTGDMDYSLMASLLFSMWSWTILYGATLAPARR